MSFIFRTIFWLSLASVIVPTQARLGGQETANYRDVNLELEVQNAIAVAWTAGTQLASICERNQQLCLAGSRLWQTTLDTVAEMAAGQVSEGAKPDEVKTAEAKDEQRAARN